MIWRPKLKPPTRKSRVTNNNIIHGYLSTRARFRKLKRLLIKEIGIKGKVMSILSTAPIMEDRWKREMPTGMELIFSQMVLAITGISGMVNSKVLEHWYTTGGEWLWLEISRMDYLTLRRQMMGSITNKFTVMVLNILGSSKREWNMEMELTLGKTRTGMKGNLKMDWCMVPESLKNRKIVEML